MVNFSQKIRYGFADFFSSSLSFPNQTKVFVMLSPVGPYFKSGFQPVDLLVDPKYIRAWPGGTGDVKCGGNYGPTIPLQKQAADESGCTQVMWLFRNPEVVWMYGILEGRRQGQRVIITD